MAFQPYGPAAIVVVMIAGCDTGQTTGLRETGTTRQDRLPALSCTLTDQTTFSGGVARDGIPSLQDPEFVPLHDPGAAYLARYAALAVGDVNRPEPRVAGIVVDGVAYAIPMNILWRHEIVNVNVGGRTLSVTYCPLTATAIGFDLTTENIERFGVSGLIFQNNLIMFDPETESLWPQMCLSAESGARRGSRLQSIPVMDMRWEEWQRAYPASVVVSSNTGWAFDYTAYPYLSYDGTDLLLFPLPYQLDTRLHLKERVLGIRDGSGGVAIPYRALREIGAKATLTITVDGDPVTVLWDREAETAMAFYHADDDGQPASIRVVNGQFTDGETGSVWSLDGRAISGARIGHRLAHMGESYAAYWFAWASFFPRTRVWDE